MDETVRTIDYTGRDNLEVMRLARNYNRFLVEEVLRAGKGARRALDFGAGLGDFARALKGNGVDVACIETDPILRDELRKNGFRAGGALMEFGEGEFDLIYSLNVLEHIQDDVAVLREMRSRLQPGGSLYLYVPAFQALYSSMDRKVGHCRRYSLSELTDKLREAGLRIVSGAYCDALGFFASGVYKAMDPGHGGLNPKGLLAFDRFCFPLNRWIDPWAGRWIGKNLRILATRD